MTPLEPPYRAGRKKHKGRLIPVLISSRNELSTHFHQRCDSCVNSCNLIHVPLNAVETQSRRLTVALFNAGSVGSPEKRTGISSSILDNDIDLLFLTETWLRPRGDEARCVDLDPRGYAIKSFPCPFRCGRLAVIFRDSLSAYLTSSTTFTVDHSSYELVKICLVLQNKAFRFLFVSPAT